MAYTSNLHNQVVTGLVTEAAMKATPPIVDRETWYSVPEWSVERLIAGRHFGMKVCYLRDGDRVFETYWTTARGCEAMSGSYGMLDMTVLLGSVPFCFFPLSLHELRLAGRTRQACISHFAAHRSCIKLAYTVTIKL